MRASDFLGHREPVWQVFSSQCSASPSSGPSQASAALGTFTLHLCLQGRWHSSTSRPKPAAGVSSRSCLGSWPLVGSRRGAIYRQGAGHLPRTRRPIKLQSPVGARPIARLRVQGLTETSPPWQASVLLMTGLRPSSSC